METEQTSPRSGIKLVPTSYSMSDTLLSYLYQVAWWLNVSTGDTPPFSPSEEIFIVNCYARGYHPRRTAQEILQQRGK